MHRSLVFHLPRDLREQLLETGLPGAIGFRTEIARVEVREVDVRWWPPLLTVV